MNLSLYSVNAFVILDTDGHRVLAKYYRPKGQQYLGGPEFNRGLHSLKEQRAFEKGLFQKTKKAGGEIILYDGHLAVYKHSLDLIFYMIGGPAENELMLHSALSAFSDAVHMLLRNQVEKRGVLENLDLVVLCLDETIDDGIIVETDSTTIASRVSRPKADSTEIVINEQTLMNAYQTMKEKMQQRIGQL
ncbi:coatomer protein [Dentipellis sp. KUC8613]|nr:coatomer protein [Dentipellis sp. KUC8613]